MKLKETLIALLLMSVAGCVSKTPDTEKFLNLSRNIRPDKIHWEKIADITFENPEDLKKYPVTEGEWIISDGMLKAVGGDKNRAVLLMKMPSRNLKIEFDAKLFADPDGKIGDITVLLGTLPSQKFFFNHGYALTTGSYWNNCSTFYKKGKALAKTEYSPLIDGKTSHISLEFVNGHIRYWIADKIILEAWDDSPLEFSPDAWLGIRTWSTDMWIKNVSIYEGRSETTTDEGLKKPKSTF